MMKIVCIPGLSHEEVKNIEQKLNDTTDKIIVLPYDCHVIEISQEFSPQKPGWIMDHVSTNQ